MMSVTLAALGAMWLRYTAVRASRVAWERRWKESQCFYPEKFRSRKVKARDRCWACVEECTQTAHHKAWGRSCRSSRWFCKDLGWNAPDLSAHTVPGAEYGWTDVLSFTPRLIKSPSRRFRGADTCRHPRREEPSDAGSVSPYCWLGGGVH